MITLPSRLSALASSMALALGAAVPASAQTLPAPMVDAARKAVQTNPEVQARWNGFLAAGLIWGLLTGAQDVQLFFLGCVAVAGLYGAATANRRILFVQTVPAVLAILAVLLA